MEEGQRDLVLRIASKIFRVEDRSRAPAEGHKRHCTSVKCWQCSRDRKRFYFEIVMLPLLCVIALCVVVFASSVIIQGGAAVALWGVIRAITKHLVS